MNRDTFITKASLAPGPDKIKLELFRVKTHHGILKSTMAFDLFFALHRY